MKISRSKPIVPHPKATCSVSEMGGMTDLEASYIILVRNVLSDGKVMEPLLIEANRRSDGDLSDLTSIYLRI